MHPRKLVKAGLTSHTVSLPKSWLKKNKLSKGDTIYILEKSDKELSIIPEHKKDAETSKKEITIQIDKKEIDTIRREITSAYLNNYGIICLIGDSISSKTKEIRRILHNFVALEISEQTSKRIVAQDLLNLEEISLKKSINRMDMIVRTMLGDTQRVIDGKEDLYDSIYYRDYDVNKLYFLLLRLLKSALKNPGIANQLEITNDKILSKWYLTTNIENIADYTKQLCESLKSVKKKSEIKKVFASILTLYLDAIKSYHNEDKSLADSVAARRVSISKECDALSKEKSQVSGNLKLILTTISNIARIVMDEE